MKTEVYSNTMATKKEWEDYVNIVDGEDWRIKVLQLKATN